MKLHPITAALAVAVTLSAQAAITSSFDTVDEGWSGLMADPYADSAPVQIAGPLGPYRASGGNPGGYFALFDPDLFDTFFRAPTAFLGDRSSAMGGTLSYDLITDASINYAGPNVVLKGNDVTLVYFPTA